MCLSLTVLTKVKLTKYGSDFLRRTPIADLARGGTFESCSGFGSFT